MLLRPEEYTKGSALSHKFKAKPKTKLHIFDLGTLSEGEGSVPLTYLFISDHFSTENYYLPFYKSIILNEEVNGTLASLSVSVPCFGT